MSRGIVEFTPLRELLPEWAAILIALVTQLGDVWFLAALAGVVYWVRRDEHDEGAAIIGLMIGGLSVVTALKYFFAFPRPEHVLVEAGALPGLAGSVYELTGTATGHGFPSGHAFMTTLVYLCLADTLSVSTRRRRVLGAATLVTVVSLSRVLLGVHYLVDVVAGAIVGLTLLLVARYVLNRYSSDRATIAFAFAVAASAVALVVSDATADAVLLVGTSIGAFAGWQVVVLGLRPTAVPQSAFADRERAVRTTLAIVGVGSLLIAPAYFGPISLPAAGSAIGLGLAVFLVAPFLIESERARGLERRPSDSR